MEDKKRKVEVRNQRLKTRPDPEDGSCVVGKSKGRYNRALGRQGSFLGLTGLASIVRLLTSRLMDICDSSKRAPALLKDPTSLMASVYSLGDEIHSCVRLRASDRGNTLYRKLIPRLINQVGLEASTKSGCSSMEQLLFVKGTRVPPVRRTTNYTSPLPL
jgi:hypothetical protein